MSLSNDRLLRALRRQPVDRTPIWIMRQAGRYLPEYRKSRERAGSFLTLCQTPELACEVTLQPLQRFDLDAAIIFSDILTIPDAMGLGLSFAEGEGPRFARPIRSRRDIDSLGVPDPESELGYVGDAIRLTVDALGGKVPLIGFSGSPWTLAAYMVEGQSGTDFGRIKGMAFDAPTDMHRLLEILTDSVIQYLAAQRQAGANVLMLFDTWGGILSRHHYLEFSLAYMERIVEQLSTASDAESPPIIVFTKGGGSWLEAMAGCGADALGLDWTTDLGAARTRVGGRVALQGNMDPAMLTASPERIRREATVLLEQYGKGSGHVFNLGHGITPNIDPAHVAALVDAVQELSPPYHQ